MDECNIDPSNGFRGNRKAIEVVQLSEADRGVDLQWIKNSSYADRFRALELLRWQTYGRERCLGKVRRVLEVFERPTG